MRYIGVAEVAKKWGISERTVRNYCTNGRIIGAVLEGKTWKIPDEAKKPERKKRNFSKGQNLLNRLQAEKEAAMPGGIYHKLQIEFTYNSNHIEGSRLTHDQTRFIFETNTIGIADEKMNVDDIVETVNHFRCIDLVIEQANYKLTESFIKQLHLILKSGTSDSRKSWSVVGGYKLLENEIGGKKTAIPKEVSIRMKKLLDKYNKQKEKSFEDILEFHYEFERIHPFQDGNGRIGRLIMFKECIRNGITPFIIEYNLKEFYYRGLQEWDSEKGYLKDTCLTAQNRFKAYLDYFGIKYNE